MAIAPTTTQPEVPTPAVDAIIDRWGANTEFAVEMLQDLQAEFRYLPRPALERIAERTDADLGRLYEIATFFKAFSLAPRGRVPIRVCTGPACHAMGSARVLEAFTRQLGVEPGETTSDMQYSLEGARCVGCCGLAAVVTVGDDVLGDIDSSKVGKLVRRYRKIHGAATKAPAGETSHE
jgi:NADH-quinone oxidoreductase subunit E